MTRKRRILRDDFTQYNKMLAQANKTTLQNYKIASLRENDLKVLLIGAIAQIQQQKETITALEDELASSLGELEPATDE